MCRHIWKARWAARKRRVKTSRARRRRPVWPVGRAGRGEAGTGPCFIHPGEPKSHQSPPCAEGNGVEDPAPEDPKCRQVRSQTRALCALPLAGGELSPWQGGRGCKERSAQPGLGSGRTHRAPAPPQLCAVGSLCSAPGAEIVRSESRLQDLGCGELSPLAPSGHRLTRRAARPHPAPGLGDRGVSLSQAQGW